MKIKVRHIMKAKTSTHCETVVTSSFRACSFAMDDGGRCLADVINDPLLLQSFLESGSDDNSKDPQDGTSSESAVESPQVSRSVPASFSNHASEHIVDHSEQMGYIYSVDNQGFAVEPRVSSQSGICSSAGLGGVSLVVASSSVGPQTYHHASSSGATIHHIPSSAAHSLHHPHSPASRPATPLSTLNIKSPGQGPSSVHSMPPPSPLQQTRSPLPSHTPSPAPAWSPAPPVLSPATSRTQSMPSLAFQQSHNQLLQTTCNVTQFVTAIATPQSLTQKLTVQQQQQLFLQQQVSPVSQHQPTSRLSAVTTVVGTSAVTVTPPVVQLITAPQSNVSLPTRTSHTNVRPIQPKLPPQILPKPACSTSNQFVSPAPASKQAPPTPVTAGQRTVGVGIQPSATGQLVVGQGQSGVFSGPQGTFLLNQIIPGVGQSPILIQGNLSNLANMQGLQLTLRPPNSASPGQPLNSSSQNNATIIAALQNTNQHTPALFAPAKSPIHGQQTIVIPNNLAHPGLSSQNINLTSTAIPNSGIMSTSSQGQSFLRSNIILSPRIVGPNQGIQLQQIQTAQGPILACIPPTIAVPHLPVGPTLQNATIGNAQLAPVTLPMHGVMAAGQGVISGLSLQSHTPPSALHTPQQSLFGTAVPFTSHVEQPSPQLIQVPQPMASPHVPPTNHNTNQIANQPQSVEHSPKTPSPSKASKALNLEDILKETGIVPENSPPLSPDTNSPVMEETVPSHLQASNTVVPSQQLIAAASLQGQMVLEQVSQNLQGQSGISQVKFALAQDGSVILQPHNTFGGTPRVQQFVQSPQVQGRAINTVGSVIIPTVTTSTAAISVTSAESSIARSHANLIARLNSPPPVSVPDVSSLGVTSIGGAITSSITTITVTTIANTVPLTVQSVNVNSLPIASTGYVMQRTNVPVGSERTFFTEDINNLQIHGNVMTEISNSSQSVQRFNHVNSGYQTFVVSSDSIRNSMQNSVKTVQSTSTVNVSTTNSINIVQAEIKTEPNVTEVTENKGAVVPSHTLPSYQTVPNQRNQVQKLQKQVSDLSHMKFRSPEQQKTLQHSHLLLQKFFGQKSSKGSRNVQNQIPKSEPEKNIIQRCQPVQNQLNSDQVPQQQTHVKTPIPQQPAHENNNKQQVSSNSNTHNLHLVNLLKQGPSMSATTKHSTPPAITTCTATVNSTAATTVTSTVNVSTHPRIVNQVVTPVQQQRLQNVYQQKPQPENSQQPQPQVIVRLPKPQPSQTVQACPNITQLKAAPPVKKVISTVPKTILISEQLSKDQNGAVCPDIKTPFRSKEDACRRLLNYHVHNSPIPSFKEIDKADETFDLVSVHLLEKKRRLENKFHLLQLKESMRRCATTDHVLLERLFIKEEEISLKEDKAVVAEGKILSLPPPPAHWIKELDESPCDMPPPLTSCQMEEVTVKKEIEDNDGHSAEFSDPMHEDSDPVYKDDDNLEAPVIDSCADIVVPQHDENCERSPPTLKRIVIKPEKRSESDNEETAPNSKRFKCNTSYYEKSEPSNCERSNEVVPPKSSVIKQEYKEPEVKTNNKFPHVPLTRESYHSDNRIDDMVTKIRKELNMSPMEMDDDDLDPVSTHVVDFEPPSGTNDLADFEPPVARTEESCDSNLLYNNSVRTNCDVKYDFEMLGCWDENYVHHPSNESDVAVDNIMNDHGNPSDLDLSGLDGLDHLEESQPGIPNGIQDVTAESDMNYIGYHIPKHQKRFHDVSVQPSSNCSSTTDQVQSAIKSIMGTPADNRSYYGADDEMEFLPINKTSHNTHIADYSRSLDSEMGVTSNESDAALDEAVRSILLR